MFFLYSSYDLFSSTRIFLDTSYFLYFSFSLNNIVSIYVFTFVIFMFSFCEINSPLKSSSVVFLVSSFFRSLIFSLYELISEFALILSSSHLSNFFVKESFSKQDSFSLILKLIFLSSRFLISIS